MSRELPERARKVLDGRNLVVLTTLNPDGSPHSSPVWALREGDDVVMVTHTRRVKARNLSRDPRASVVVMDPDDPICYFSINGSVELTPDEHTETLDRMSLKYLGTPYPPGDPENRWLTVRLRPDRVYAQYEPAK